MTAFWRVVLGIITANSIWAIGWMIAFKNERVLDWLVTLSLKMSEKVVKRMEEE